MNSADLNAAARSALFASMGNLSARWSDLLTKSGFTPTEASVFASGGMAQAIFDVATVKNAEEQARDVAALLKKAGYSAVVVLEPSDDDPVWMVSGKA